jgi:CRP-like cAMP-binding protein
VSATELKRFGLLSAFDEVQREDLENELEVRIVDADELIFEEGTRGDGLVLVAMGEILVASERRGGAARFGPGTALGALSLVAEGPRESSARAATRARLLLLDREGFRRLVVAAPRSACALLEAILVDCADAFRAGLDDSHESATSDGIDPTRSSP